MADSEPRVEPRRNMRGTAAHIEKLQERLARENLNPRARMRLVQKIDDLLRMRRRGS